MKLFKLLNENNQSININHIVDIEEIKDCRENCPFCKNDKTKPRTKITLLTRKQVVDKRSIEEIKEALKLI